MLSSELLSCSSCSSFLVSSCLFSIISLDISEELFIFRSFFVLCFLLLFSEDELSLITLSIKTKFFPASNNFSLSLGKSGELPLLLLLFILPKYFNFFISLFFYFLTFFFNYCLFNKQTCQLSQLR
jgi:hypothetical protein